MTAPFAYRWEERHEPLMREQVWEAKDDLIVYAELAAFEFAQFESHVPRSPKVVLEVGCGLGRGSVWINHLLADPAALFILADRDGITPNTGAFDPPEDEHYDDLALAADFCRLNGLTNTQVFDTERGDWWSLPKADFVFSLCSFGMHVSIERYLDRLIRASAPDATMVFGVREPRYREPSFADRFGYVAYLEGADSGGRFPREDWLILKRPRGA